MKVWITVKEMNGTSTVVQTPFERAAQPAFDRVASDNDRYESVVTQYEVNLETLTVHVVQRKDSRAYNRRSNV